MVLCADFYSINLNLAAIGGVTAVLYLVKAFASEIMVKVLGKMPAMKAVKMGTIATVAGVLRIGFVSECGECSGVSRCSSCRECSDGRVYG